MTPANQIENQQLFELNQPDNRLSAALKEFLGSGVFPWELLGDRLRDFICQQIESVPLSERIRGSVHSQSVIEGDDVVIEKGAVVEAGALVQGPTYVCAGATIRHGAYVRGQVHIGADAVVGHTTEIKGSLLLPGAKAAHFAYVGNSVLGCESNLGAGTKLANLRFDHGLVVVKGLGEAWPTQLKKCGALLGNRAQTGCNSVTNPGTLLTADSYLKPTELGTGVVHRPLRQRSRSQA